jgi:FKBP-type peptidyl-prolyl cis-trans isomerase 2
VPTVKNGDTVKVHYTGKLGDGSIFDSSTNRGPLEFTVGQHQVVPGFEEAVLGMSPGEAKTSVIPAGQAYGLRDERLVVHMDRNRLPEDLDLEPGDRLQIRRTNGQIMNVTVTEITESSVTLDGNHFLAGQDLTFDIQLVEIF